MRHSEIQTSLYDYLNNTLSDKERAEVEHHLAGCPRCDRELNELKATLERIAPIEHNASTSLPQEYWNQFAARVEQRILSHEEKPKRIPSFIEDWLTCIFPMRRKVVTAIGSGLAIAIIAIILWKQNTPHSSYSTSEGMNPQESATNSQPLAVQQTNERVRDYFRKSRTLLVGITNMKLDETTPADFSLERERSRDLIHEARYLKSQSLDRHSEELIRDMEKILIELSSIEQKNDLPNVEIVRSGIHQENLLFKIRMAESMYSQPTLQSAKYSVEGNSQ
jgi:hypothetical protein